MTGSVVSCVVYGCCPSQTTWVDVKSGGSMTRCVGQASRINLERGFDFTHRKVSSCAVKKRHILTFLLALCQPQPIKILRISPCLLYLCAVFPCLRCSLSRPVARPLLFSMDSCLFLWRRFMPCLWWTLCSTADSTTQGTLHFMLKYRWNLVTCRAHVALSARMSSSNCRAKVTLSACTSSSNSMDGLASSGCFFAGA